MGRVFGPRYHCELSMDNGSSQADRIDRYAQMRTVMALESIAFSLDLILWVVFFAFISYAAVETFRRIKT